MEAGPSNSATTDAMEAGGSTPRTPRLTPRLHEPIFDEDEAYDDLPDGWEAVDSETADGFYWWNMDTDETTWDKPPPPPRNSIASTSTATSAPGSPNTEGVQRLLNELRKRTAHPPSSPLQRRTQPLQRNSETGVWETPRYYPKGRNAKSEEQRQTLEAKLEREMAKLKRQGAFEAEYLASGHAVIPGAGDLGYVPSGSSSESAADGSQSARGVPRLPLSRFVEKTADDDGAEPIELLDLGPDLLACVIAECSSLAKVLAFKASCKALHQVVAKHAPDQIWNSQLDYLGVWDPKEVVIDKQLAVKALEDPMHCVRWRSLRVSHPQRAARRRAVKNVTLWRTGSAGCVVDTIVLVYGGTLNGNIGPYCDDLLVLSFDIRAAASLFARADAEDSRASPRINVNDAGVVNPEESPGARRGHTMTTVLRPAGTDGKVHEHDAAVVIGGWVARADTDVTHTGAAPMHPMLLVLDHMEGGLRRGEPVDARPTFRWVTPEVAGTPPSPRAFHSATHIGGSRIGVFGGLLDGESSCEFFILYTANMAWVRTTTDDTPKPTPRAGHGALWLPAGHPFHGAGRLLLFGGTSRTSTHDDMKHSGRVEYLREPTPGVDATCCWNRYFDHRVVNPVRTFQYCAIGTTLCWWGGFSDAGIEAIDNMGFHNTRRVVGRNPDTEGLWANLPIDALPCGADHFLPDWWGRSGAVVIPLGPMGVHGALMIGGELNREDDDVRLVSPTMWLQTDAPTARPTGDGVKYSPMLRKFRRPVPTSPYR